MVFRRGRRAWSDAIGMMYMTVAMDFGMVCMTVAIDVGMAYMAVAICVGMV